MSYNNLYTEEAIVDGILRKDAAMFSYLYNHYAGTLLKCITRVIPDKSMAADVLQNVFIKIYSKVASYDAGQGRLFTWMLKITRHECVDVLQSKAYTIGIQTLEVVDFDGEEVNPYRIVDVMDVQKFVINLPPDLRILIELSFYYGLSNQQIALLLYMSIGTVNMNIREAYQSLRESIKKG